MGNISEGLCREVAFDQGPEDMTEEYVLQITGKPAFQEAAVLVL